MVNEHRVQWVLGPSRFVKIGFSPYILKLMVLVVVLFLSAGFGPCIFWNVVGFVHGQVKPKYKARDTIRHISEYKDQNHHF